MNKAFVGCVPLALIIVMSGCGNQDPETSTSAAKPEVAIKQPDGELKAAFRDFEPAFQEKTEGGTLGKIARRVLDVGDDSVSYRYYLTQAEFDRMTSHGATKTDTVVELATQGTVQLLIDHAKAKGLKVKEFYFRSNFIVQDKGASGDPVLLHLGYSTYNRISDGIVFHREVGVWEEKN